MDSADFDALEERARARLAPAAYAFAAAGADDEITTADNVAAWRRLRLRPRMLNDITRIDTGVSILGVRLETPIMVAPFGRHRLFHPDGERATGRGAAAAGSVFVLPTTSTVSMEDVAAEPGAGAALVPALSAARPRADRESDRPRRRRRIWRRRAHRRPAGLWLEPARGAPLKPSPDIRNANLPGQPIAQNAYKPDYSGRVTFPATWRDLEWLVQRSSIDVLVKGVLRGDDALRCVEAGAKAVIVSNHGGRHLDASVATADALPEIAAAVARKAELYVDGGIRRGTDIVKALALGARAVLVARPVIWGWRSTAPMACAPCSITCARSSSAAWRCAAPRGSTRSRRIWWPEMTYSSGGRDIVEVRLHTAERASVGLVGIGLLGQALAHRLLGAGFEVAGFDVDPAKNARLAQLGGRPARRSRSGAALRSHRAGGVHHRPGRAGGRARAAPGAGRRLRQDRAVREHLRPDRIAALGGASPRGLRFLETPVSGSSGQVSRGEGVGLIGGDPQVAAEIEPILRALFPNYFHIGGVGDGGRAKLAVNLILGLNRLAMAEGLVFAERLGLDPAAFLKVARGSAAYSQVMDIKGPKMTRGDFAAEGRVTQHLKDVHLMLEQAERAGQRLPLLEVHADVLEACVRQGEGDWDNSAVIAEIRRRTT